MEKKYMIPATIGIILLSMLVFTFVYKQSNKDLRPKQEIIETLAPKETTPIETKVAGQENNVTESSTVFEPDIIYLDSDSNVMEEPSIENALPLDEADIDVYENYENSETQSDLVVMAESYVNEQSVKSENEDTAQEFREITDEMHQEFQDEIDRKTQEQAEALMNKYEAFYESYYANEGGE